MSSVARNRGVSGGAGVNGNEFVRGSDPETSHRAVDRLMVSLSERRAQCVQMVWTLGEPCSRNEVREQAQEMGFDPAVAETIRRRVTDLINLEILFVVDGSGDSQLVWFTQRALVPKRKWHRSL
jgi:hypothetical protein